jgi:hypothetical protein
LFVNEYFMRRAKSFMSTVAKTALDIEHYWGCVEFAPGRGAIHLHIVAIAKDMAYLQDFYHAKHGGRDDLILSAKIIRIAPETSSF